MPEYLAPGVYVEEVSSGNKPIQAASTSTAGMVGMAARGPVNIPTLITSLGQANRVFGGKLDHHVYGANLDALPYAIEGFFKNGGARVYVTRIVGDTAERAETSVYSQDMAGAATFDVVGGIAAGATALTVDDDPDLVLGTGSTLLFTKVGITELVTVDTVTPNASDFDLTLAAPGAFANAYPANSVATLVGAEAFKVHGIYAGNWGDDLRVMTQARNMLTSTVTMAAASTDTDIVLASVFGVEPGTYLQFTTVGGAKLSKKVASVNRSDLTVTLTDTIGSALAEDDTVVSLEFDLVVQRLDGDTVVESERFDNLALDPAHSGYAPTAVGTYDDSTKTISSSGQSELIRLDSFVDGVMPLHGVYFGLDDGDDDIGSVDENTYIGTASDDPDQRTGIEAMINENDISIVAVPGQTGVSVQKALIAHCEKMRYRFAVLDAVKGAKLSAVQKHRQNYDTTFGAFYYPWLTIADPFGVKGDEVNIAPSGHMLGVYARTDVQRGVHKAPANEVVKSILSFETRLTKGEQDVLNPIHVNCFRDFRDVNRGLRIYGARTLSSDPEWRYVNVRRLFLFLEKSVDTSMQWAVFEPNAEPLWATVKRSLVNFLNTVWRSGALEGTTQDEAFYVNVGLDTMSQTDIDNGRLIVEIGVAPTKPAEFVIFRFSQKTREAQG
jgi:phage tail sheath protein FI